MSDEKQRCIVWFSHGAASAVAILAAMLCGYAEKYELHVVNCDTGPDEHEDNTRFEKDVAEWLGVKIEHIRSQKFRTVEQVARSTKYMAGVKGARCTVELKKVPRFGYQRPDDIHIFGFGTCEASRAETFKSNNPELVLAWPMMDLGWSKADCFPILEAAGIKLPAMYLLGYKNNNCIGCFKATSAAYWNKIRVHFPEVFAARAAQSRALNVRLTRVYGVRKFLDELPPEYLLGAEILEDLSCGPQCAGVPGADT